MTTPPASAASSAVTASPSLHSAVPSPSSATAVTWKDWTVEIGWLVVVSILNAVFLMDRFQDTPLGQWYTRLGISIAVIAVFGFYCRSRG